MPVLLKGFCICFEQKEQQTFPLRGRVHAAQRELKSGLDSIRMEVEVAMRPIMPASQLEQAGAVRGTERTTLRESVQFADQTVV